MKKILLALVFAALALGQNITTYYATPQVPVPTTVTQTGTAGTTEYCYWIVADYAGGNSAPAGPLCTYTSNATLSTTNYNVVSFLTPTGPLSAVTGYDILRTTSQNAPTGACACAVATSQSSSPVNDQSNTLSAYTVTTATASATEYLDNTSQSTATLQLSAATKVTGPLTVTGQATVTGGIKEISTGATAFTSFTTMPVFLVGNITDVTDISGQIWFSQIFIPNSVTLTGICVLTGTATTDSFTMGLYNTAGTLVAHSALAGATLSNGSVPSCQTFTSTVNVFGPQSFYVAIQGNGTTAASFYVYGAHNNTGFQTGEQSGTFGTLAAITPTTSFTASVGPVMSVY